MWLSSNFLTFFIMILMGGMLLLTFRKFRNIFRVFKINNILGSMRIFEIENDVQCVTACHYLKSECQNLSALGFDCEWICLNGTQRPVALLQLASASGLCCLFRLNKLSRIPKELREILNDPKIIKTGVSPKNDAKLLFKDYNVQVYGTLDLRYLYPIATGLASLANAVIGVQLDKSWRLRCSNWESFELTDAQKYYAAKDAFVAIEIFKKWLLENNKHFNLTESKSNSGLLNEELNLELFRYIDIPYQPKVTNLLKTPTEKKIVPEGNNIQNLKRQKAACVVRKSPLYDNCFMNAPDGRLLCSCDRRKAQWYVDRGLAEVLPGEPYTIKLLFEPAARAEESSNGEFYRQLKQNCCVVCGASESYLRHNVVPKEYRKHFPPLMKDHQSHDVVLMCVKCHYLAGHHNENLRKKLALSCNAPINSGRITENKVIKKVKNCAKALILADKTIPEKRKTELENEIKQFFEVNNLSPNLLKKAVNLESKILIDNNDAHGLKVVNYYKTYCGGLKNLELLWREHFLDTMKPKYLPTFWSPTHNHSRLNY